MIFSFVPLPCRSSKLSTHHSLSHLLTTSSLTNNHTFPLVTMMLILLCLVAWKRWSQVGPLVLFSFIQSIHWVCWLTPLNLEVVPSFQWLLLKWNRHGRYTLISQTARYNGPYQQTKTVALKVRERKEGGRKSRLRMKEEEYGRWPKPIGWRSPCMMDTDTWIDGWQKTSLALAWTPILATKMMMWWW
jgi:hypothetical protein